MTEVVGGKRPSSASSNEENVYPSNEEKRPRRLNDRVPLANQANYITVSVPDDGRRTRICVRNTEDFRGERIGEENFLVWTCSKSWRDLKEVANDLVIKAEHALARASTQSTQVVSHIKSGANTELWLKKYSPTSYMDLVSDEATNRVVLQWFRLWDKAVFGKERKPSRLMSPPNQQQQHQQQGQQKWNNKTGAPMNNFNKQAAAGPSMDPSDTWPAQRICLLTGPPGLGKTTLAHIAARHCGYEIVEVNASDDRSANVFRDYLESVAETRGMLNVLRDSENKQGSPRQPAKPKPACLILDEIDGAPAAAVDVLISYVTGDTSEKSDKSKRKKGKKDHELRRPVICICNDLYATSLRNLRRHCFVVTCLPPPPERLVFRVGDIAKRERIEIESRAVSQIVERARGDIRVCINILQTLKGTAAHPPGADGTTVAATQRRNRDIIRITADQIARLPRMGFNKDVEQSMFDCLQTIFRLPPVTSRESRYETVCNSVQMNTDHELLISGIFENYPCTRVRDDFLVAASKMADWLAFADTMQSSAMSIAGAEIGFAMTYTTTPLVAGACHLLFATPQHPRFAFPKATMDMRQLLSQRNNQMTAFMAGMMPSERIFFNSPAAVVFDLLPSLLDIIQPTLRPVSAQLYSTAEKIEISRVVEIMASLGLTFVQRLTVSYDQNQWQTRGSQLGFYLEPPVDSLVVFDKRTGNNEQKSFSNLDPEEANKTAHSAPVWRLPQTVRQLLASEITLYLAKRAAIRCGPLFQPMGDTIANGAEDGKDFKTSAAAAATIAQNEKTAELLRQLSAGHDPEPKMQTAISSYFSRTSSSKKNTSKADSNSAFNAIIRSPPGARSRDKIWYRFNEGYSNAVRRPARVKQFF